MNAEGPTSPSPNLLRNTLLKAFLLLQTRQPGHPWCSISCSQICCRTGTRCCLMRWSIVFDEDALAVGVKDEEGGDCVEGEIALREGELQLHDRSTCQYGKWAYHGHEAALEARRVFVGRFDESLKLDVQYMPRDALLRHDVGSSLIHLNPFKLCRA